MAFMEHLEHSLTLLAKTLKLILESVSILCILVGLLKTGQFVWSQNRRSPSTDRRLLRDPSFSLARIRLSFGCWLSLALEFQLAADIVNTTVAPSFEALGRLGAIALIRTFLNFFLTKELDAEMAATDQSRTIPSLNPQES